MSIKVIMKKRKILLHIVFCSLLLWVSVFNINKLLVYLSLSVCDWPAYEGIGGNETRVMLISDLHFRSDTAITFIDNSIREWQMSFSFGYATKLLRPEVIFILGDIFDDGETIDDETFRSHVIRFAKIFWPSEWTGVKSAPVVYVINGNHDIGFHYTMTDKLKTRFDRYFKTDSVKLIRVNDINFVTINSITMEGDYCQLCSDAEENLKKIGHQLCPKDECYSGDRPIVLTHFPLFRENEALCGDDWDSTPESEKYIPFKQKWDCLSTNATKLIVDTLRPRLVVNGHQHYGCVSRHDNNLYEWTVASFNYRNTHNPSLLLLKVSKNSYSMSKCILFNEIILYFINVLVTLVLVSIWYKFIRR